MRGAGRFVSVFRKAGVDSENFYAYTCKDPSIVIERYGSVVTTSARHLGVLGFSGHTRGKLSTVLS